MVASKAAANERVPLETATSFYTCNTLTAKTFVQNLPETFLIADPIAALIYSPGTLKQEKVEWKFECVVLQVGGKKLLAGLSASILASYFMV